MNREQYKLLEKEIFDECDIKLHQLRKEYVEKNKKFNIGDFVGNITGIIKIDKIKYNILHDHVEIVYIGLRYKKINKQLLRTKEHVPYALKECNGLILI